MKLERYDIYSDAPFEPILDERGSFTFFTPELQEAWDKQQEIKVLNIKQGCNKAYKYGMCPKCQIDLYEEEHENYCPSCGQKIKW